MDLRELGFGSVGNYFWDSLDLVWQSATGYEDITEGSINSISSSQAVLKQDNQNNGTIRAI